MIDPIIRFIYYKAFGEESVWVKDETAWAAFQKFQTKYINILVHDQSYKNSFERWKIQKVVEMLKNEK